MYRAHLALLLTIVCVLAPRLDGREWKDSTGRHSIEAAFISCNVVLRLPTGETKTIDLDKLSQDDRRYIAELLTRTKSEPPELAHGNGRAADGAKTSTTEQVPIDTLLLAEEKEWQNVSNTARSDEFFRFERQMAHDTDGFRHYATQRIEVHVVRPAIRM
jgi:hypothetical protein